MSTFPSGEALAPVIAALMRLKRRDFLHLAAAAPTAALVGTGAARAAAPAGVKFMSADEAAVFTRLAQVVLPVAGTPLTPWQPEGLLQTLDAALLAGMAPHILAGLQGGVAYFNEGPVARYGRRFTALGDADATAFVDAWGDSKEPSQRGLTMGLKKLVQLSYWANPASWGPLGYGGPVSQRMGLPRLGNSRPVEVKVTRSTEVPPQGLKVTQASDIHQAHLVLNADAVVVGSGAGGAIAAYELAKAGKNVVVLEAGPYVPSDKFAEMLAVAMGTLYQDQGGQSNMNGDIAILQGACVGGSTVVNAALCFRTPDYYLKLWAREHGLVNLTPALMKTYFEKVEANLHIREVGPSETSPGAIRIGQGMKKLGLPEGKARRNIKDCANTGFCFSGCATDRKQSMLVTYLPWAVAHGARIHADTRVTQVLAADGRATGVKAEVVDPATGQKKADLQVNAPIVVLAAGPVQTPVLLMKSGLANRSGQVGKNFACHPTLSVTAVFDEAVRDFHGATHSLYMDRDTLPEQGGYLLLNAIQEPVEASFQAEPGTGKPYMAYMQGYKNTLRLISLIHDKNVGEVRWTGRHKEIHYTVDDEDFEAMKKGLVTTCEVLFASGAKKLLLPTSQQSEIASAADVKRVIGALRNEPARYKYTSFHPQGTCRMGADPERSVVNPYGETHDVKRLYVVDASLLPTSIGYNPSETVYALASYISDQIVAAPPPG